MAAESLWKVRPAARKFKTDPDTLIPAVRHPLDDSENRSKLSAFWTSRSARTGRKEENEEEKYTFEDPLGATIGDSEIEENVDRDVLQPTVKPRSISLDNTLENRKSDRSTFDIELPDFQPWREKRAQIASIAKPKEFGMSQIDMLRARLKLLADEKNLRSLKKAGDVSQKFLMLRENMISAWGREDRVEAFKIVTESAHLLQSIPPYSEEYPYYWLLAIDVVDTFGKLVFDRLLIKSNEARNKMGQTDLSANFTVEQVPKSVKDMAMNWFLKLSEIIDIPVRFYIECSMIICLKFFDESNLPINLERLALMCSQFPDDLSSIFARVHISRYSMLIQPLNRTPHWRVLHDWMQAPKDIMEDTHRKKTTAAEERKQAVSIQAIAWLVQCVAHGAHTVEDLVPLFAYCRKTLPLDEKTFILVAAVIEGLPSKYLAVHAEQILDIVFALHEDFEEPLARLGRRYTTVPPIEENRKFVKRSVWMRVADISDFQTFVDCCTSWTAYIAKYYSVKDVRKILDLVLVRLTVDEKTRKPENTSILVDLLSSFIEHVPENSACLSVATSADFISIVDIIGHDIESTSQKYGLEESEEVKIVEQLVCSSYSLIDFHSISDRNQSVELIVRCREDMGLRQNVLIHIITFLFDFTQFTHATMKSGKRKADFMRVCITNLALTIPAVRDVPRRIRMTGLNIQMAQLANFLPQIEVSCERVIEYLEVLSASPCSIISPLIGQFLPILCIIPEGFNPEKPSLTHFSKLLALVERNHESWSKESRGVPLAEIYINMLRYLCAARQVDPLRSSGCQEMHAGDQDHLSRVDANISDVIAKLFSLAAEPSIAVIALENVVMLFEIHEEMRSTIRGLLKRSVGASAKLQSRLDVIIQDLREEAETDQNVRDILQRLSLL
ncbi:unnamed protein product [Caenorhabditis sp. 36 PRJEB53466]|nr:unnamed protein product [Caenorhabditis sp. 36 PRJEB53466]